MAGQSNSPPDNYEDLTQAVHDHYDGLSKSYQKVARFVTQNPNDIAMLSVNALSARCGVHASSLVRFAQQFGFKGFKELQVIFQNRLATAAPGFDARIKALKSDLDMHTREGMRGFLSDLVVRDITSLENLMAGTSEEDLARAVDLLEQADTIYLVGQLRSEPIANLMRYILTMLGRKTTFLDTAGGLATQMAKVMQPGDVLLAVSFRFYATEVVNITEDAAAHGVPIIAISDSTLSPLAKTAEVLFAVPEDEYAFSRSLAAPMCLAQALMVALASRLQKGEETPRIPVVTEK